MKKLIVDVNNCTGCKRCETACMEAHRDALVEQGIAEPRARIYVESQDGDAVPVVCRHCTDALCVSACMSGAMQKDPATGLVSNEGHRQKCVGCWMCIMACPYGVISTSTDTAATGRTFAQAVKCDVCPKRDTPACVEACPNRALAVVQEGL